MKRAGLLLLLVLSALSRSALAEYVFVEPYIRYKPVVWADISIDYMAPGEAYGAVVSAAAATTPKPPVIAGMKPGMTTTNGVNVAFTVAPACRAQKASVPAVNRTIVFFSNKNIIKNTENMG